MKDAPESDFVKVIYALEEDKLSQTGRRCLVKRENTDVFSETENTDLEIKYTLLTAFVYTVATYITIYIYVAGYYIGVF